MNSDRTLGFRPRLVLLGVIAAVGIPAAAAAVSAAVARIAPDQATAIFSSNPDALNQRAAISLATAPKLTSQDRAQARKLLRRSLASTLLNPNALRLMGIAASETMDDTRARPWMQAASAVAPRNSAARIWLALDAAKRGQPDQTIHHVDYALRSSSSAAETMIPLLIEGLADPYFQRKISELVKKKVVWASRFLDAAVHQSQRPDIVANVVIASGGFSYRAAENEPILLQRLVTGGYFGQALRFAGFVNRDARQIANRVDIADAVAEKPIAPLSWQIHPDTSSIVLSDDEPAILAQFEPDRTEVIANKLVYSLRSPARLTGSVQFTETALSDALQIEAGCPTKDATAFQSLGQPIRATTSNRQNWTVNLVLECDPVEIRFVAVSTLDGAGNELMISNLAVR